MKKLLNRLKIYFFSPRWHLSRFQLNLFTVFVSSIGLVTGIYLALYQVFPSVFALNDTSNTWTFSVGQAANYTYDSNLVAVDGSGAHPVTGVNKLTNPDFSSDNSSWSITPIAGSTTPAGYIPVPGNSTYTTGGGNKAFLAMAYEAKYDCTADGDGDTAATCSAPADSGAGLDYRDLTFDSANVVSTANGAPIVHITQTQALSACPSGYHLISNAEWMTIVRNAEAQTANWANGTVGSTVAAGGGMFRGNVGESTSVGYNASTDPDYGTGRDTKAKLTLSNGSEIWDLSGNVWDWNSDTITGADQPDVSGQSGFAWREYTALTGYGSLSYDLLRPSNSSYNADYGVGRIYHDSESVSSTVYAFLRGGYWNDTSNAGAFALHLNGTPSRQSNNGGFRCASDPVDLYHSYSSSLGRGAAGGDQIFVGTISDAKVVQSVNVGDTSTYDLSTYVYDNTAGNVGGTVSSSIAQLYYNGGTVTTTYTDMGSGWWKLTGQVTGANEARNYGALVKSGKTVILDDFTLSKNGTYSVYTTLAYSNSSVSSWDSFCEGTITGGTCSDDGVSASGNASVVYQLCTDDGSTCESGGSWKYWDGGAWTTASNTTTHVNTAAELTQSVMQALSVTSQKIAIKAIMGFGGADTPAITNLSVGLTTDTTGPTTNASAIAATRSNGGTTVASNDWTNNNAPYFSWTAGADNAGGVGLKGYCLYLGADPDGDPATSKGILGTSPVSTAGSTCQFIVAGTSIDFATSSYRGSTWLTTGSDPYYLNIKAIDNAENVYTGSSEQFQFRFDNTPPTNVSYVSCPGGSFANVADMNFSWPTSGATATVDDNAGVLGWQYQINTTGGTWLGTTTESTLGVTNYIPTSETSRTLTDAQDGGSISTGSNIVYFRSVDAAGNVSSDASIRTCSLEYGGAAPTFGGSDSVTVTPSSSTSNSFALSWPEASATVGQSVTNYYYMVNVSPPSTLATLTGNATTYVDNGTATTVSAAALPGVNKGSNNVYVVAVDDADNYSPSNYISGTFTLNSTDPDNVSNLVASDSSIKSESKWYATLTWTAPTYQGAGNLTYLVYRSTDGTTFTQVGTTTGLSYVDNTPASTQYYYKIYTKDGANATSSGTNAVTITPTGRYTTAPTLSSGPSTSGITTKKAKVSWSTSRSADSKVAFGTSSGSYNTEEPSSSSQVTDHEINLTGLTAGTTYYYKAKWTDEDGNTGESEEKSFTTSPAPTVFDVSAENVGLTSGIIQYTVKDASKVKIYYGTTTNFGGVKEISTSTSETTYTTQLTGLDDGTKYYYKINAFDSENAEYEGTILDFTTLPRPKISGVRLETVANAAQTTIRVTWSTNTEVSSIVTYYPEDNPGAAKDEVKVLLEKGAHSMLIRGLNAQTKYLLVVKGRDKLGNEAVSDVQRFTTATDTRPPQILNLKVIGGTIPPVGFAAGDVKAQLIVTWDTDEPATSQVEFGQGSGNTYSQKSQFDGNLTNNHTVILSGLVPSQVYHLRAISQDGTDNTTNSTDMVTIAPKATRSALDLVIKNLSEAFGFVTGALDR